MGKRCRCLPPPSPPAPPPPAASTYHHHYHHHHHLPLRSPPLTTHHHPPTTTHRHHRRHSTAPAHHCHHHRRSVRRRRRRRRCGALAERERGGGVQCADSSATGCCRCADEASWALALSIPLARALAYFHDNTMVRKLSVGSGPPPSSPASHFVALPLTCICPFRVPPSRISTTFHVGVHLTPRRGRRDLPGVARGTAPPPSPAPTVTVPFFRSRYQRCFFLAYSPARPLVSVLTHQPTTDPTPTHQPTTNPPLTHHPPVHPPIHPPARPPHRPVSAS